MNKPKRGRRSIPTSQKAKKYSIYLYDDEVAELDAFREMIQLQREDKKQCPRL